MRHGEKRLTWAEILEKYFQMQGASIVGRAYLRRAGDLQAMPVFWEIGVRRRGDRAGRRNGKNSVGFAGRPSATWAWRFIPR